MERARRAEATLRALGVYVTSPEDTNAMAGFSSWGPTHGDLLVKPDVVAPGTRMVSLRVPGWKPSAGCSVSTT